MPPKRRLLLIRTWLEFVPAQPQPLRRADILRLNLDTPPVSSAGQNRLGVIGGDNAGWPNGRRPGDDVVDISLRALMGQRLPQADAPAGQLPWTDGVLKDATFFHNAFPYLTTPDPGGS